MTNAEARMTKESRSPNALIPCMSLPEILCHFYWPQRLSVLVIKSFVISLNNSCFIRNL
jgi:hypothetical protein